MKTFKALILGLIIIIFVLFVVQNLATLTETKTLRLNLLFFSAETPQLMTALLLIICFVIGFVAAYLLGYHDRRKMKKTIKSLKALQNRTDAELQSLRNLPIVSEPSGSEATPLFTETPLEGPGLEAR